MEIWKEIPGTNGEYQVSNIGRVKTTKTGRILRQCLDNITGYYRVCLFKTDRRKRMKVHRLVAAAFIPNPDNLPFINHIDGNKLNNNVSNLEWCTAKHNSVHARRTGLMAGHDHWCDVRKKPVIGIDLKTGEKEYFDSIHAAQLKYGSHVADILSGNRYMAHGHTFVFKGGDVNANRKDRRTKRETKAVS